MNKIKPLCHFFVLTSLWFAMSACTRFAPVVKIPMTIEPCVAENQQYGKDSSWSWLDITIGYSTERDLVAKLGRPQNISPWPGNATNPLACIYRYQLEDGSQFWVAGNKVIGIGFWKSTAQFNADDLPGTMVEAIDLYGRPEIVGWSSIYGSGYRSVIWVDRGIQAEIDVYGDGMITDILYFTPVSDFSALPWARLVLEKNPTLDTDSPDMMPRDPFDWGK